MSPSLIPCASALFLIGLATACPHSEEAITPGDGALASTPGLVLADYETPAQDAIQSPTFNGLVPMRPAIVLDGMGLPGHGFQQAWRMQAQAAWEQALAGLDPAALPTEGSFTVEVQVKLGAAGALQEVRFVKSSGWTALDESVKQALETTAPQEGLPAGLSTDEDGFLPAMNFTLAAPDPQ